MIEAVSALFSLPWILVVTVIFIFFLCRIRPQHDAFPPKKTRYLGSI